MRHMDGPDIGMFWKFHHRHWITSNFIAIETTRISISGFRKFPEKQNKTNQFGDPSLNGPWVLAQTGSGLTHTHGWTERQTQATTIPEGQNWPRIKTTTKTMSSNFETPFWSQCHMRDTVRRASQGPFRMLHQVIQVLWPLWVICLSLWLCKETMEQSMGSSCKATRDPFSVSLHNPNDRHLSAVRAAQGDSGKGTVSGLWKTVKFSLITWSQKALQLRYPMCLDYPITKGRRRPCLIRTRGARCARCPGFRNHTHGYGDWESKQ